MIEITLPAFSISNVRLFERFKVARGEWAIVVLVTLVAALPRLALLTSIPGGLHGDEAWTGIDAKRILDTGLIGPYVSSALGQPSGPLYFAAPFVAIFGQTVFSIRFAMALLGVATVPLAYATFRLMFNRNVGAFAALLLAVSIWHIHYSRIAFMVISWPFVEMIALLLFFQALRTQRWIFFALTGLVAGLGVYTYNAYPVFLVALGVLVAWEGAINQRDLRKYAQQIGLLAGVGLIAATPLLMYISDSSHGYTQHHKAVSILETEEWKDAGPVGRGDILWDNARYFARDAFWEGVADFSDGAGSQAMVDRVSLGLLLVGLGMAFWSWRRVPYAALLIMAALLPLGTVLTTQGTYRQTLGLVPFLAALEALPLAFIWGRARDLGVRARGAAYVVVAGLFTVITILNMNYYFGTFPDTDVARYTFAPEFTDAAELINRLPSNPYVYLYSNRWGLGYETRVYLAPKAQGEDRSAEFSKTEDVRLQTDRKRDVLYMFLGLYIDRIDEVERLYPGGTRLEQLNDQGEPEFRAYYLPALKPGETPPVPLPTFVPTPVTTQPGGDARDGTRQSDLGRLRTALEEYKAKRGSYPSNNGGIQSLCVYKDDDVGCKLESVLKPLPQDPLGDPASNGYFYSSDGRTFTIYAQRESDEFVACPDHPDHLAHFSSLLCVKGP